jgi:hypothetical protein
LSFIGASCGAVTAVGLCTARRMVSSAPRRRVERLERLIDSFVVGDARRRHASKRRKATTRRER